jgi:hypothetical protein
VCGLVTLGVWRLLDGLGVWRVLGDLLEIVGAYTVRDPPFRRWRMGTLSENLCLCDSRGSNTLSECSNVD